MSHRPSHYVGANAFVIRDGKLLLGKRKGVGDGQWGLPGGHLEIGERFDACCLRELTEETGMTATGISFSAVTNHSEPQADKNYINFGFLVDGASGEPRVCEPDFCSEWQWFPLDALPAPLFFGHEELIRIFLDRRPFSEESTF